MSGYGVFARYYDALTGNVDYSRRALALDGIMRKRLCADNTSRERRLVLDLACGTGSLSMELSKLGCEVIGVDSSAAMLSIAEQKNSAMPGERILFLNQDMEELDLFGTVDAAVCALDGLNHIGCERGLMNVFKRVSLFTNPGGLFLFDVNTLHKHRDVLGGNAFVYDLPDVCCCWQNEFCPETGRVDITLDFFAPCGNGLYARETESFSEWFYSGETLLAMIRETGFEPLEILDGDTLGTVSETTERLLYIVRRL